MNVVFLGDSITAGFYELKKYPHIINMGISGNRTTDVIERLATVKAADPTRLFLMIGINDIMTNHQIWFTDLPISIETTYRFIVRYLVKNLDTIDITLLSILPVCSIELISKDQELKINQEIDQLNKYIENLSKEYGLKYLDLNPHFKEAGRLKRDFTTDGIHLTTEGYRIFYKKVEKLLK